ncbi:hypothetical protein BOX15_Mlig025426g1 [Macrostomum lignano]|uniref:Ig-like domain-containing protein n=1 Tax=Macrostomum lignano TaxID=282301 RepID=A0A267ETX7_9PLAT|nr:hypothetical protein BOX15_Mlig025426g1 [Macrostomum lignano]
MQLCQVLQPVLIILNLGIATQSFDLDCSIKKHKITLQLSRADVLRTWQPGGAHCRWWESRQSETNRFPAAVRSGPRWLVMQLRQPMMLEAVSVRDWDRQWHTAAPVGSPVSAVGASSLPLELQLEDPCRASWEAFGSSEFWMQISSSNQKPISYIRLASAKELSFSAINISGYKPTLKLDPHDATMTLLKLKEAKTVTFHLMDSSSRGLSVSCFVRRNQLTLRRVVVVRERAFPGRFSFKLKPMMRWQGSELICCYGNLSSPDRGNCTIVRTISVKFVAKRTALSVPKKWLVNSSVLVNFTSVEEYPPSNHSCVFRYGNNGAGERLDQVNESVRVTLSRTGFPAYTTISQFLVKADRSKLGGELYCRSTMSWSIATLYRTFHVSPSTIVEPCQASISFGLSSYWLEGGIENVTLTSPNCGAIGHSCELVQNDLTVLSKLNRTYVIGDTSTHQLQVRHWMRNHRNWQIVCRANQSDLHSNRVLSQTTPIVFYKGNLTIQSASNALKWSVQIQEGRPQMSNVSCSLTNVTTISTSIRSYSATVKIVCVGLQMKNGDKIFQVTAIKTIGGKENAHNAVINHMEAGKENSLSQNTPTTCDTLRLVLFTTVVCGLLSVASVIGCATIMLRRAAAVAAKKVSTAKALGGCRQCHCLAGTVRAGPRNQDLAAAVPPSLRASLKTCTDYEDPDVYSQIGSCLKSPYVNYL